MTERTEVVDSLGWGWIWQAMLPLKEGQTITKGYPWSNTDPPASGRASTTADKEAAMTIRECYYCKSTDEEMRPYGPGMSWVCFDCGMEHEKETERNFDAQIEACGDGLVLIGEETGPRLIDTEELEKC